MQLELCGCLGQVGGVAQALDVSEAGRRYARRRIHGMNRDCGAGDLARLSGTD